MLRDLMCIHKSIDPCALSGCVMSLVEFAFRVAQRTECSTDNLTKLTTLKLRVTTRDLLFHFKAKGISKCS